MAHSERLQELVNVLNIPGELIAVDESLVFKVLGEYRPKVWQVYTGLDISTVKRYQILKQRVAHLIDGKPGSIQTSDGRLKFNFTWHVVQIEQTFTRSLLPVAVSNCIDGYNNSELIHDQSLLGGNHILQQIEQHDPGSVHACLTEFCNDLNIALGTTTVWFTPVNTKTIGSTMVVTDVCPYVGNIRNGL
jgi:hypothetical protein